MYINSLNLPNSTGGYAGITNPILQRRKLKLREEKGIPQNHTAGKWKARITGSIFMSPWISECPSRHQEWSRI